MAGSHRSAPIVAGRNAGVLSGQGSSYRVGGNPSRRPSLYTDARYGKESNDSEEDDSSDDDLFKRNKRGRR